MTTLIGIKGLENWLPAERKALVQVANRLGMNPDYLVSAMKFESGLNEKAINKTSGASGLIQFMPSTAKNLGTTIDAIRKMSKTEQLVYVEKYFQSHAGKLKNLRDVYAAIFYPAAIGKSDDFVIANEGSAVYSQNQVFDKAGKGFITVKDITAPIQSIYDSALANPRIAVPLLSMLAMIGWGSVLTGIWWINKR